MNDSEYVVLMRPVLAPMAMELPLPSTLACATELLNRKPSLEKPPPILIEPVDFSLTLTLTST